MTINRSPRVRSRFSNFPAQAVQQRGQERSQSLMMIHRRIHLTGWRQFINNLREEFREQAGGFAGINAQLCGHRTDLIGSECMMHLICETGLFSPIPTHEAAASPRPPLVNLSSKPCTPPLPLISPPSAPMSGFSAPAGAVAFPVSEPISVSRSPIFF